MQFASNYNSYNLVASLKILVTNKKNLTTTTGTGNDKQEISKNVWQLGAPVIHFLETALMENEIDD